MFFDNNTLYGLHKIALVISLFVILKYVSSYSIYRDMHPALQLSCIAIIKTPVTKI